MKLRVTGMMLLGLLGLWAAASPAYAGTKHYYYTDPQGTPLAKADASGTIIATYDYAPYGTAVAGLSPAPSGPGYTGHVNDPDTGLVYMQARYYDPAVGRFLSIDPVGPQPGNGFNFNRFSYGKNNPVKNLDPDGRDPFDPNDYANRLKTAAVGYVVNAAKEAVKGAVSGVKDVVKEHLQTNTYTASFGASATVAAPLGAPFLTPAVGPIASANVSINSHGQVALNGSIGAVAGDGGGAAGGLAFGVGVAQGGAVPKGPQPVTITNHVEADFSGVPGVPINVGIGVDWNQSGFNASSGAVRGSFGTIMFLGGGKQFNFSYTINE